ncbi:bifunctional 3-demethylubiquinone-9 3-methyltransferase and 2-octaprenyl-6-hydroxy phenol methylase [Sterolibacterium denitrificans]|uniref:Ubiquinone biosynthesis O-methyltransferase n=1 Tax=Sterolibacterium denitrificans TaxID=157592 RepID=A0A7Z7MW75_9PROT|nr:bifunctional 2-polyprenyl-6-hydroxyphenol methylase/3-demethylubiquinol 3-O-methyltransferase UbiG [Sterolibacterium denitrificans]SMB28829.1 bifunctional 3-demethylubiquinone-9 3-methyltransferase and 2-octaprenyl-6-hydroxy phenol methylase [Sterolibacterium denitrificans]
MNGSAAHNGNADRRELDKFAELAHRWWDPNSEFKPLHDINPLRLDWIDAACGGLAGKRVIDVGCGGGILAESMAARGARVTGIDLGERALSVARLHLLESGEELALDYRLIAAEDMAAEAAGSFDVVTCMEMLEHVPDPASTVRACAALVRPGGRVFLSTINRNPKAYLFAVVGAEYILDLLPRGTHDYARFLRPAELSRYCRQSGLAVDEIIGMSYNLFDKTYSLGADTSVNYLMRATLPANPGD